MARNGISEKAHDVVESVKDLAHAAQEGATRGIDRAQRSGRRAASRARDRAVDLEERATSAVEDRPLTSVLVALGIGILLGSCMRRR